MERFAVALAVVAAAVLGAVLSPALTPLVQDAICSPAAAPVVPPASSPSSSDEAPPAENPFVALVQAQPEVDPSGQGRSQQLRALNAMLRSGVVSTEHDPSKEGWDSVRATIMDGLAPMITPLPSVPKHDIFIESTVSARYFIKTIVHTPPKKDKEGEGAADDASTPRRAILYLHSGGMCFSSAEIEAGIADELALRTDAIVYNPNYRLLPDVNFNTAVDDMLAVYQHILKSFKPEQVVVTGCSGGGMAALFSALEITARDLPQPAGVLVLSPGIGHEGLLLDSKEQFRELPSVKAEIEDNLDAMVDYDMALSHNMQDTVWLQKDTSSTLNLIRNASVVQKLPPMRIQAGEEEMLLSVDKLTYDNLKSLGAPHVEWQQTALVGHCFSFLYRVIPEGDALLNDHVTWMEQQWNR